MLNPNISVTWGTTEDEVDTFVLSSQSPTSSTRIDPTTTLANPRVLNIKHSTSGSGKQVVDRHLVQIARTELAPGTGASESQAINLTIPQLRYAAAISLADTERDLDVLGNFLFEKDVEGDGRIRFRRGLLGQLLRGEV